MVTHMGNKIYTRANYMLTDNSMLNFYVVKQLHNIYSMNIYESKPFDLYIYGLAKVILRIYHLQSSQLLY